MGRKWWLYYSCFLVAWISQVQLPCDCCWEEERVALLRLKPFFPLLPTDWDNGSLSDCCSWEGVNCDTVSGRVNNLDLDRTTYWQRYIHSSKDLYYLNASLFLPFQHLTNLSLRDNFFGGCVENGGFERLSALKYLEEVDLSENFFDNSIFASLQHLSSLRRLYLSENRLNRSLPIQELNNLEGLVELDMSYSIERFQSLNGNGLLTGTDVLMLPKLEYLDLTGNNVNTDALSSLRGLSSLRYLVLAANQLKVIHVKDFDALNNLEYLSLGGNRIEKFASSEDGERLKALKSLDLSEVEAGASIFLQSVDLFPSLEILDLSWNTFDGSTTDKRLCKLTKLRELDISYNGLSGDIPSCFSNLTSLESLNLSNNSFNGSITDNFAGLCKLTKLRELHIQDIGLTGDIPSCFSNLTALESLVLSHNKFRIPCSLAPFLHLSKLKSLDASHIEILYPDDKEFNHSAPAFQLQDLSLSGGQCAGGLPKFLYHQHDLERLILHDINFGRQHFPYWLLENNTNLIELELVNASLFGPLTLPSHPHQNLSSLDVRNNFLNGSIPRQIGAYFPSLTWMDIQNNQVVGSIPSSIGDMKFLSYLDLSNNKLSGLIPEQGATGCSSLWYLVLSNNSLSGRIPSGLSNCSSMSILDISDNNLYGGIPSWIANMTGLKKFIMANNILEGPLPLELFNLPTLYVLDISDNAISGSIPSSINLPQIYHIHLSRNHLRGTFPNTLCNSPQLITLDLSDNNLTGTIPEGIKNLDKLSFIILKNNSFNGQIPVEICQLSKLSVIDLSHNNLVGFIPPCLTITTFHQIHHGIHHIAEYNRSASTDGNIEFRTKSMSYTYMGRILIFLSGIDLSCNKLTGEIPREIGSLNTICVLNLSHNSLTGGLPLTISYLSQIESLDLSFNNLTGRIPPQIVELTFLVSFNVSYNNLSGPIPKRIYQFAIFDDTSYKGNPSLCGEPLPRTCPPLSNPKLAIGRIEDDAFMDMEVFYISFVASYVTSLLAAIVVLWINPSWRRRSFYYLKRTSTCCYYWVVDHLFRCF